VQAKQYIKSPRIEVVLVPDSVGTSVNAGSALFDLWVVLHVADGENPVTVRVEGGPFDRADAVEKLCAIWTYVGRKFAEPTAKLGIGDPTGSTEL
jgi:hypothetical protein